MTLTTRDSSVDAIKGFLILCVVYGHFNYFLLNDPKLIQGAFFVNELIYFFHMPLFLVVSFLFIKPLTLITFKQYSKTILIPYSFWVFVFFTPVLTSNTVINKLKAIFYGTYAMGAGLFWFFAVLFLCKLMMSFYRRIEYCKHYKTYFWVCFGLVNSLIYYFYFALSAPDVASKTPFNFIMCLYIFPLLFFSHYIYLRKEQLKASISLIGLLVVSSTCFAYIFILAHKSPTHRIDLAPFIIPHRLDLVAVMALLWASFLLVLNRLFSSSNIFIRYLARLGFYSLPIFIFHMPIKGFLETYGISLIPETMVLARTMTSIVIILLTCEACIFISWFVMSTSAKFRIIGLTKIERL